MATKTNVTQRTVLAGRIVGVIFAAATLLVGAWYFGSIGNFVATVGIWGVILIFFGPDLIAMGISLLAMGLVVGFWVGLVALVVGVISHLDWILYLGLAVLLYNIGRWLADTVLIPRWRAYRATV